MLVQKCIPYMYCKPLISGFHLFWLISIFVKIQLLLVIVSLSSYKLYTRNIDCVWLLISWADLWLFKKLANKRQSIFNRFTVLNGCYCCDLSSPGFNFSIDNFLFPSVCGNIGSKYRALSHQIIAKSCTVPTLSNKLYTQQ